MERIMVMGSSPGAGKSTFARRLGLRMSIPVYHLDVLFWRPGWKESSIEEFASVQETVVKTTPWIIEGNYSDTLHIRTARADTLIFVDAPLSVCLWRVVYRRIKNHKKTRPDIAPGCPEKLDPGFLWLIVSTYHSRRRCTAERLRAFESSGGRVLVLKGNKALNSFLNGLSEKCSIS